MIVERDFPDHWKTTLITELLGPAAPIGVIRLWGHCEARRNDHFPLTTGQLAAIVRIPGKARAVEAGLIEARWIERDGPCIKVLGWRERNAGWLAKVQAGKDRVARGKRDDTGKLSSTNGHATNQLAGVVAGGVEWSGVEKSREENTPPSPRASAPACVGEPSILEATARFIIDLLAKPGKKTRARLSREAEDALGRQAAALPLNAGQQAMLQWFYGLPSDSSDFDLERRYRDADSLATNLFSAIERAEAYSQKNAGAPSASSAGTRTPREPWPIGTREWFEKNYRAASREHLEGQGTWWDLPESVRSHFELKGAEV